MVYFGLVLVLLVCFRTVLLLSRKLSYLVLLIQACQKLGSHMWGMVSAIWPNPLNFVWRILENFKVTNSQVLRIFFKWDLENNSILLKNYFPTSCFKKTLKNYNFEKTTFKDKIFNILLSSPSTTSINPWNFRIRSNCILNLYSHFCGFYDHYWC